jgi:hypothetical protein
MHLWGDDPVNETDPLGLYISGQGTERANPDPSSGEIYTTGASPSGVSVAGSYDASTGATTGAFISNASPPQCGSPHGTSSVDNPCDQTIQAFNTDIREAFELQNIPSTNDNVWAVDIIIWGENRGKTSCNENDINAINGDPSCGIMQTIEATFEMYADPQLPNSRYDSLADIYSGINYANSRYDLGSMLINLPSVQAYLACNGYCANNGGYTNY